MLPTQAPEGRTDERPVVRTIEQELKVRIQSHVLRITGSIPATGKPTFELDDGLIGLGMGIHGEAGVRNIPMTTADELTPMMLDLLFEDFANDAEVAALTAGDEIVFFINSLGATTMMECLICMKKAAEYFQSKGIEIFDTIQLDD